MGEVVTKVVVVGVILLIIASIIVPRVRGRRVMARRVKTMTELAASQGWSFTPENNELVPLVQRLPRALGTAQDIITSQLVRAEPTRLQVGSRIMHVLEGASEGHQVRIFDWVAGHASGAGRASLVFLHTVWAIPLPQVPFWAQAASKGQPHDGWRPGQVFRTGDNAFDKRFLTTADDAGHVQAGLAPQTRRLLLESDFDGWRLDPEFGMLLLWTHSRRRYVPAERILPMTRQAKQLAAEAIALTQGQQG
ncbi:hypothetical protein ABGB14_41055 [Nonomuraea sp. B10E15]|uniref:hypothetical protein n=1 Tax=Nonomuraea sp. B10E15 TaxID=3153560 RepID=UPI00325F281C